MKTATRLSRRYKWQMAATALFAAAMIIPPAGATDSYEPPFWRIEEDWVLVLNEPDSAVNAPQFHTLMSPFGDVDQTFGQVTWNYREYPEFAAGGMQLQGWDGEELVGTADAGVNELSTVAETIAWTQALETDGTTVTFSVINGQSTTWGAFGGDSIRLQSDASVNKLNQYQTSVSTENSWITYGDNRVDSLVITEVRRYGPNGLVLVDSTPKVVFQGE